MPKIIPSAKIAALMTGATLLLAACASITDTPNQQVQVLTPGATGARCNIANDYVHYVVNPPEKVMMLRARDALTVTCEAPGNRSKTVVIYPKFNPTATENMASGGLSGVYDYFSGALYEYPNPVTVDFRQTQASDHALPGYHAPDTVSPFDQQPEDMRDGRPLFPGESNLPPASAPLKQKSDAQDSSAQEGPAAKVEGADTPADGVQADGKDLPVDGTDIGS